MRIARRGSDERRRAAVEAEIRDAVAELRPLTRLEHFEVELVEFSLETGVATLRVEGGCRDCEMSAAMLMRGIEQHLRMRVPALREVRAVGNFSHTNG